MGSNVARQRSENEANDLYRFHDVGLHCVRQGPLRLRVGEPRLQNMVNRHKQASLPDELGDATGANNRVRQTVQQDDCPLNRGLRVL